MKDSNAPETAEKRTKKGIATMMALGILLSFSGPSPSFAQVPVNQVGSDDEKGFEAFKKNVHPLLLQHCASCHSPLGPGPAHSVADARASYVAIKRDYMPNFADLRSSKLVVEGLRSDMAGDTLTPEKWLEALQNWWDEGENTIASSDVAVSFLADKKKVTPQKIPALPQDGSFTTMRWELEEVDSGLKGVRFEVEIQRFAQGDGGSLGAYRLRNPRLALDPGTDFLAGTEPVIEVEGVHLVLNGVWNSMASSYGSIRTTVSPSGPGDLSRRVLSRSHQIVLARKDVPSGERVDEIGFAFTRIARVASATNLLQDELDGGPAGASGEQIDAALARITNADLKGFGGAFGGAFDETRVGKAARFVTLSASPERPIEFEMGSPPGMGDVFLSEYRHRVRLTQGFEVQITEATQLQWYLVMPKVSNLTPSYFRDRSQCDEGSYPTQKELDDGMPPMCKHHPVEQVSWEDVCGKIRPENGEKCGDRDGFIKRLNTLQSDYDYNLLTEAQWEYVAHAGLPSEYAYGWGNDFDDQQAWYVGNSAEGTQGARTHAVATRVPTVSPQDDAEEIYDIAGNVWEWVQDSYREYREEFAIDPQSDVPGSGHRVYRGGAWDYAAIGCRAAGRYYSPPRESSSGTGFRLMRRLRRAT